MSAEDPRSFLHQSHIEQPPFIELKVRRTVYVKCNSENEKNHTVERTKNGVGEIDLPKGFRAKIYVYIKHLQIGGMSQ